MFASYKKRTVISVKIEIAMSDIIHHISKKKKIMNKYDLINFNLSIHTSDLIY